MRLLFALTAFVLTAAVVVTAQDTKPAQPDPAQPKAKAVQPKAVQPKIQPVQPKAAMVTAARMAQLEEEFETLEAHRDVKKAYVRAAEVSLGAAKARLELIAKAAAAGNTSATEKITAEFEVEMAKAQFEIRQAELKEVEVKVKYAKKRLEDAKAAGVRPLPGIRPVPLDPLPNVRFAADEKVVAELKAKIEKLAAEVAKLAAESKKAEAELKVAEAELKRIEEIAKLGRIKAGTIEAAEAKVKEAKEKSEKLSKQSKALEASITDLRAKLKEIEK
jgi:hypothetical protein